MKTAAKSAAAKTTKTNKSISGKSARTKAPARKAKEQPAGSGSPSRAPTKTEAIIKLLRQKGGASVAEIIGATYWQAHSVRGFLSGTVKRKLGYELVSESDKGGVRRYRIAVVAS